MRAVLLLGWSALILHALLHCSVKLQELKLAVKRLLTEVLAAAKVEERGACSSDKFVAMSQSTVHNEDTKRQEQRVLLS